MAATDTTYCANCGAAISNRARFCPTCGARQEDFAVGEPAAPPARASEPPEPAAVPPAPE
ncbi:MAG: zinc-ribbon domain-containing protein, partial [Solirubrobacteraceae bacterium]